MIVGLFPSLASVGGVQLAGRQTAAALVSLARNRDWRCAFLSLNDAPGEHSASVGDVEFNFQGFARQKGVFFVKALRLARNKPKVVFAAHPNLAPIAAMMKAVSPDAHTIVGAHGIEIWQPLSAFRRMALRRADIVTAPSSDTARRLAVTQNVPEEKIRVLPWSLDPEFAGFAKNSSELPVPAGFPVGRVVLSVGRWASNEGYKGADRLIQAIAELSQDFPELHLVLVGGGDDLPRLKKQAQSTMASKRIHFLTGLSRAELAGCYAGAEIFALPSRGEGFGLVFLEAMAFGKPVIGTSAGGIPDVVENGREGLLVEPNVEALASALKRLLFGSKLREELGAHGRRRVNTDFVFENFQRRLHAILDESI